MSNSRSQCRHTTRTETHQTPSTPCDVKYIPVISCKQCARQAEPDATAWWQQSPGARLYLYHTVQFSLKLSYQMLT